MAAAVRISVISAVLAVLAVAGCGGSDHRPTTTAQGQVSTRPRLAAHVHHRRTGYGVPPLLNPHNVYAADRSGEESPVVQHFRSLVYVPDSAGNTVQEIDPRTYRIIRTIRVGAVPQHVVPSYDLRTLWVTNDIGNSLTAIDPRTGKAERTVPVADPYNLYFTPDGRYAVVMAEALRQIDFRDAHTMKLHRAVRVPQCAGVNHADYTADGRSMLISCEFAARMVVLNVARERVIKTITLPAGASPQDVKLSPDGRVFYVADLTYGGVWLINAHSFRRMRLIRTGASAHGLYPSRNTKFLYVSNRGNGTVSVISFARRKIVATWRIPGGGSPDMGGVSASGRMLWLSGRYNDVVYAIDTQTGKLLHAVPVGLQPHGLCVYPQPGRYSLGHTGVFR